MFHELTSRNKLRINKQNKTENGTCLNIVRIQYILEDCNNDLFSREQNGYSIRLRDP